MLKNKYLINALDLFVLSCLAIAQPVFDVLGKNVGFLAARNSDATEIVLLVATTVLLLPILLIVLELSGRLCSPRIYDYFHRMLLYILVLLFLLPPMKPFYKLLGYGWILIPLILTGIVVETYLRFRSRGLALAYLSPLVLFLPGLFLFHSPARSLVLAHPSPAILYPAVKSTAPIIMVVFDEFPLVSLMNSHGEINPLRYPNIARFAGKATWYRNASTNASSTLHAIPALVDGKLPDPGSKLLPIARDHANSLFALLGGSYRLNVIENNTHLCPEDLCGPDARKSSRFQSWKSLLSDIGVVYLYIQLPANLTRSLPSITQSWKQFAIAKERNFSNFQNADDFDRITSFEERPQIFRRFIESIHRESTPTLNFLHVLLPHAPWEYLPSGKKHSLPENNIRGLVGMNDEGINADLWNNDLWALQQAQKKHLLQVEMVDRLAGDLIRHLEEIDMFKKSLVVITADHGTSFHRNVSRRSPSRDNYFDIMAIPLFIKYPNQDRGVVDDTVIETIDILPTIADSLGVPLPWKIHGKSVLNSSEPRKTARTIILGTGERMVVSADLSALYQSIREKESTFGRTPEDLFRIGPHTELVGKSARDFKSTRSSIKCNLEGRTYFENIDLNSQFILSNIKGTLESKESVLALPAAIAISINGTIAGITQAYSDPEGKIRFSLVVSDSCFRSGSNQVRIYLISATRNGLELVETEDGGIPSYHWGETLTFGEKGTATIYQTEGWSKPEEQITWTSGRTAELVLPVATSRKAIKLRMFSGAYLKPGILDRQRVKLYINRQPVADWVLSSRDFEMLEAILPAGKAGNSGNLVVTFELPDCVSPNAIGDGEDIRRLGLAVSQLSLSESQP
jgi:hypothetical protein